MTRFWKRLFRREHGQVLPLALAMLALGGLIIAPGLDYAGTSLKHTRLVDKGVKGLYAADAGIEKVLWALKRGEAAPTSLPGAVNGMTVTMSTTSMGSYTLIAGEWVVTGPHTQDLLVSSSDITWDATYSAWKYVVTITWTGDGNCWLIGVGAKLPLGYNYQPDSVDYFPTNLSTAEPSDEIDQTGAHIREWSFPKIKLNSPETRWQRFLIGGSGPLEDYYGWAEAEREDVGQSGELTGSFYIITATATKDGAVARRVQANVMLEGTSPSITSYRVQQ